MCPGSDPLPYPEGDHMKVRSGVAPAPGEKAERLASQPTPAGRCAWRTLGAQRSLTTRSGKGLLSTPHFTDENTEAPKGEAPLKIIQHERSGQDLNPGLTDHILPADICSLLILCQALFLTLCMACAISSLAQPYRIGTIDSVFNRQYC